MNLKLGLPRVGRRQSDGKLQPNKQQTVRYTAPVEHPNKDAPTPDNRLLAVIDSRAEAADRTGQTVVDEKGAKDRGFLPEADVTPTTPGPGPRVSPTTRP